MRIQAGPSRPGTTRVREVFLRDRTGTILFLLAAAALYLITSRVHPNFVSLAGDDGLYYHLAHQYSLGKFVLLRYQQWSGRLFAESAEYLTVLSGGVLYHLLNPLFCILLAFSMVRCVKGQASPRQVVLALGAFCSVSYLVLHEAVFWLSGACAYTVPLALGVTGLIPFANLALRDNPDARPLPLALCGICLLLAPLGNEQVAAACCLSVFCAVLARAARHKRIPPAYLILAAVLLAATLVNLFSPGSSHRFQVELGRFPGFRQLSPAAHIQVGAYWLFSNLAGYLWLLLLLLSSLPALFRRRFGRSTRVLCGILYAGWLFALLARLPAFAGALGKFPYAFGLFFHNGDYTKPLAPMTAAQTLLCLGSYLFWTLLLLLGMLLLVRCAPHPIHVLFYLCTGLAVLLMIPLSPTLFASGYRTLFVGCALWLAVPLDFLLDNRMGNTRTVWPSGVLLIALPAVLLGLNLGVHLLASHFPGVF